MKHITAISLAALLSVVSVFSQGQMPYGAPAVVATPVVLPVLPAKLDFAGEQVPLANYDTRESLTREVLVTIYMHSRTWSALLNSERYFSIIEPILARNGIPADFKYLCVAESGLNPEAVSVAKAGGLWQIMPATGRDAGLEVGTEVDERFHIEKSTEAACRYLLSSYRRFGSWTLAAAAYNLGEAGVATRMEKQGINNYYDLFLPEETRRYLFRILSFKMLFTNPSYYGYDLKIYRQNKPFTSFHEIAVSGKDIDWSKLAAENGTTYKILRELNPWIRDYRFANKAGKTYNVKIPNEGFRTEQ